MANVVVTATTSTVKVDFGVYASQAGFTKGTWPKSTIQHIQLNDSGVQVQALDIRWWVSLDGANNSLIVDTVEGVAPSSLSDLYNKISALIE